MKTIKVELSSAGIKQACSELDDWYRNNFQAKVAKFTQRLAEAGYENVEAKLQSIPDEFEPGSITVTRDEAASGYETYTASYYMGGGQALFIEFGAGIHYNVPAGQSKHPKGSEFPYKIGEYRKGSLGRFDSWRKPNGEISHGTPTYAPMYYSAQDVSQNIAQIAKEVFGNV